jgi:hypothetical protein
MGHYKTKYFGEILIDETRDFVSIDVTYKNNIISISLSNCNIYKDKLKKCLEILDNYIEINEIAKKAIRENFPENKTIKYYFKNYFELLDKKERIEIFGVNNFNKFDITKTVENLKYPDLLFNIDNNEITVSVDYKVAKGFVDEILEEILSVRMNEELKVIEFEYVS